MNKLREITKISILMIIVISFILVNTFNVSAQVYVSNSANWEDVYSVMMFADLIKHRSLFTTSERHALLLPYDIPSTSSIKIISSSRNPHVAGYASIMKSYGRELVEEERLSDINLELASRSNVTNFIIIDPAYSYNAVSVAPYALLTDSYVLFVNRDNVGRVVSFLNNREVDNLVLYGTLQREVRTAFNRFNPEIINENGDKFLNNIEISKKVLAIQDFGQVILSSGEFLEYELLLARQPVIFVGKNNVPPKVAEYIKSSTIAVGVLIGNELINSAQTIRAQTGISTIIKFGRGARQPSDQIMGEIEALDMFYLPPINISIIIHELRYNKATNRVEVTIRNNGAVATYIQGSYTLNFGFETAIIGDEDVVFIDAGELKTFSYQLNERFLDDNIRANALILFGESLNSLEYLYDERDILVSVVDYEDNSALFISDFYYDLSNDAFVIEVSNPGTTTTYATGEIIDFFINLETRIIGGAQTVTVHPGKKGKIYIYEDLVDEDFINNPEARVRVYYGEQETILINVIEEVLPLVKKRGVDYINYFAYTLLIVLVVMIINSTKKCDLCGKINPKRRKSCKNCGAHLKKK